MAESWDVLIRVPYQGHEYRGMWDEVEQAFRIPLHYETEAEASAAAARIEGRLEITVAPWRGSGTGGDGTDG